MHTENRNQRIKGDCKGGTFKRLSIKKKKNHLVVYRYIEVKSEVFKKEAVRSSSRTSFYNTVNRATSGFRLHITDAPRKRFERLIRFSAEPKKAE